MLGSNICIIIAGKVINDEANMIGITPAIAMQKIDAIKYNVLLEKLKEAEVSMESVVELFHVNTLQELDINQWNKLIRKLEVTIAAKAGRKES